MQRNEKEKGGEKALWNKHCFDHSCIYYNFAISRIRILKYICVWAHAYPVIT